MDDKTVFLSLKNVTKTYKDIVALDKISFEILTGEVFGYIGPNGAGKTTTIKILVGLVDDFEGSYEINNHPPAQLYKKLGYLPQGVSFQEWRTVDNVLKILGRLSGLEDSLLEKEIERVLDLLDLGNVRYRKIPNLSGGMIQKLGLAQALLNNPLFLVLDEPLSGLDPTSRYKIKKVIKRLSDEGTTVFFSSHILSDVQDIANRIAILHKGRILKIGDTQELRAELSRDYIYEIEFFAEFEDIAIFNPYNQILKVEPLTPNKIRIHVRKNTDLKLFINQLNNELLQHSYHVQSFHKVTPNLDDVYLEYTDGR